MRLTLLGSCSGTEPMPDRHHVSFVVEYQNMLYWFDAGECCSYTAHLLGLNLLATRAVFITHTHMDHIGGLPNLLWTIRKLESVSRCHSLGIAGKTVDVFLPDLAVWEGILAMLKGTEGGFKINFALDAHAYGDGTVYDEGGLRVTALHNAHLGRPDDGDPWRSFSFRIEAGGRSVVFSGDVKDVAELDPLLDSCDLLLMETGHHKVEDVCGHLKGAGKGVGRLGFIHHGRAILTDPAGELRKAKGIFGDDVFIADDGMTVEV